MTLLRKVVAGEGDLNLDAWGTQKVVQDFSIFHGMFTFDVPPALWLIDENGVELADSTSTRATSIAGRLNIRSGTTNLDTCNLSSRRHPRYQPNRGVKWAASIGFKGANLNGILKAGLITQEENGVYFKTKGDGFLYACILRNGVETHEEKITFPFTIDITKGNIYDIQMQWRGAGHIKFYAGNPDTGLLVLVHTIEFLNTLDEALSINNPALSATFYAENITQEVNLWCGCVNISSEGGRVVNEQYGSVTDTKTVSSGAGLIALKSPSLINGKVNTRDISLVKVTVAADKKTTVKVYRTRDATAISGGSFGAFFTGSFLEKNTTIVSVDVAKMDEIASLKIPAGGTIVKDRPSPDRISSYITHGDYIVLVCSSGSAVEIDSTIEWGEEV